MENDPAPAISAGPPDSSSAADAWFSAKGFSLALAALILISFFDVLVGGKTFFYRDYGVLGYPVLQYEHDSFWRGEIPLWNPLSNCGSPLLAQWGTMALYPFSLLYLVLPLPWSASFFSLAHLFLGGLGMFHLARRWTQNNFAASVGGFAFAFNGLMFSCLLWPNYLVALGWMPWVVLKMEDAWTRGGRALVVGALLSTLQLLAGVPEVVLLTWIFVLGLFVLDWSRLREVRARLLGRFFGVVLLVAVLSAAQLLPFFDLLVHSQRDRNFATAKWALPPWGWANLLVPLFHCFITPEGTYFQFGQEFFSSTYLGLAPWLLAIVAAWRVRQPKIWLAASLAGLCLILALGDQGFIFRILKGIVPLIGIARYPVKFLLLTAFLLPLLAAQGVSWVRTRPETENRRFLFLGTGAICLLMGALLYFMRAVPFYFDQWESTVGNTVTRMLFLGAIVFALVRIERNLERTLKLASAVAVCFLLWLDARTHLPWQNPSLPANVMQPALWQTVMTNVPAPVWGESRVMISRSAERALLNTGLGNMMEDFLGKRLAEWSNLNLLDGIPKVNGSSTLQLREQAEVQRLIYDEVAGEPSGLLDFLGASHISAPGKSSRNFIRTNEWLARPGYLPLVTAGQNPVVVEPGAALRLLGGDFNPRTTVYLDRRPDRSPVVKSAAQAKIVSRKAEWQRIECVVEAESPAMVVIAQSYFHSWKPTVDGQPVVLWRANHAFQALEVPAGTHTVLLVYRDDAFWIGLLVSLGGLAICAVLWRRSFGVGGKP